MYILVSDISWGVGYCSEYLLEATLVYLHDSLLLSPIAVFPTFCKFISLFSMLTLEFRLVSQYICLLFIRILSIIDIYIYIYIYIYILLYN